MSSNDVVGTTSVLVNATPHPCTFYDGNDQVAVVVSPSGWPTRAG